MKLITIEDLPWDRLTGAKYNELPLQFIRKYDGKYHYIIVSIGGDKTICRIYSFDEFTRFVTDDMDYRLFKSNITNWMRIWSNRLTNSL